MEQIDQARVHYIDESGIDNDESYAYGWAPRGKRLHALKPGTRTQRISIIAALKDNCLHSPFVFEGYTTKQIFETYITRILIPNLKPGDYVVLDNASFHKGSSVKTLIEDAGCILLYLPAYSPDLNPIEHFWYTIKNSIRKFLSSFGQCLIQATQYVFDQTGKLA